MTGVQPGRPRRPCRPRALLLLVLYASCALAVVAGGACKKQDGAGGGKPGGGGGGGGAGNGGKNGGKKPEFPVETIAVEARRVEYTVAGIGSVEVFERVQLTARVAGVVDAVRFVEGQAVAEQQPLVAIEGKRFQLAARSARVALERAQATRAEAEAALARREEASTRSPGLIPAEELQTHRTRVRTAAAEVAQATVALERALLDVRDSNVRAPIGGVMQTRSVETGQYVQPGAVLGTLVRRDPLLLRFEVSDTDAARIHPGMAARFRLRDGAVDYTANITHVAEEADPMSRMVAVTAEIDPAVRASLRAGAFAEVTVEIGAAEAVAVIPQGAVRPSERGFLAFVIVDGVARERILSLGLRTAEGLVEVKRGLAAGEILVVRGAEALRDGAAVKSKVAATARGDAGP